MIPSISLEVTVLLLGIFMLLAESFSKSDDKRGLATTAIFVLTALIGFSFFARPDVGDLAPFYVADGTALFFKRIALLTTVVVLIMALEYKEVLAKFIPGLTPGAGLGEFYSLPVFTCAGLMFMASAVDFLLIFVSLELVTVSFYVLVAYMRRQSASLEAGVKYLILGALSTGFLVYGITWVFGVTGQTNLAAIERVVQTGQVAQAPLLFGIVLILVGLGFKVAAVPFQLWVPDVYQGAPTPITAFLSVGSKAAGFIVLLRVLQPFLTVPEVGAKVLTVVGILAGATLIYGNLAALPQDNFKRLLAYSSIAHAGYLLVAVASVSSSPEGFGSSRVAVAYYLAGYLLMTLLSFLILIVVAKHSRGDDIAHFNGLSKRSPFLAFGLLIAMLSLAGIPFTVGFVGKFLVFATAVQAGNYGLVGIGIITVAAGFYYYLRVVAAMYWAEPGDETPIVIAPLTRVAIVLLTLGIFVFGIFPRPLLESLKDVPVGTTAAGGVTSVPPELLSLAHDGKDQFERGNYLEAEKSYRQILAKVPNNLYALSNLGVVLFRSKKLDLSEEFLKKAIAVAPEDSFSHCTLGIVYYEHGKYDGAVNELTRALSIDPNNATAHQYLGLVATAKGWPDAARMELEKARELDPSFGDPALGRDYLTPLENERLGILGTPR